MKKIISLILSLALCIGACIAFTSCGDTSESKVKINPDKEKYVIGICEIMEHQALTDATNGFKDALTAALSAAGREVEFKHQNAQGDGNANTTIINSFITSDVDLILANGTAALTAAYNATETIPIIGTSITDYATALGINDFTGVTGCNVSGTSDLAPLTEQADIMIDLLGLTEGSIIGLIYCSAEANSKYQIRIVKSYLEEKGIICKDYAFSDSNDIPSVAQGAASTCDAIYIPTDNTAVSNADTIYNVCSPAGVPVFVADTGSCAKCGFATLSASYYNIGKKAGEMAAEVLLGKADITTLAIESDQTPVKMYNKFICDELGINTEELEAKGFTKLDGTDEKDN